ncbi:MAG: MopE-related protein [bacterium]
MSGFRIGLLLWLGLGLGGGCSRDNPDFDRVPDAGGAGDVGVPDDGSLDGRFDGGEVDGGGFDEGADAVAVDAAVDRGGVDLGGEVDGGGEVDRGVDLGPVDDDGDGVAAGEDCDDGDETVYPGAAERCDGRDEDCDEAVDEGVEGCCAEGRVRGCGSNVGACRPGAQRCDAMGRWGACMDGVSPRVERCDGLDDDCDGVVDEGFGLGEGCVGGGGACAVRGARVCDGEGGAGCDAVALAPGDEVCDGVDGDCDGVVDEGGDAACTVGVGACAAVGVTTCVDGVEGCDAVAGAPVDEVCDGVDDDCDGAVDEVPGLGEACGGGVGACAGGGVPLCVAGEQACDAAPGAPVDEVCDGVDGDCDGEVDEDWPSLGGACVVGAGDCRAEGVWVCAEDGDGIRCAAPPIAGVDEVCDGDDDDCDGAVDEGLGVGELCFVGVGACVQAGARVCDGAGGVECDAVAGEPVDEVCDGVDDDCDGVADEGLGVGEACVGGVGACAAEGLTVCGADGALVCDAAPGAPGDEVCDGVDDDCDGRVDEGVANACGGCGAVPVEVCDGVDDDCDGQVDEGLADVCVVLVGSVAAPMGAVSFGSAVAAGADLDGDGVGDAVVGAPDGEQGMVAMVSGAGELAWWGEGPQSYGAAVALGDLDGDGETTAWVGQPGADNGYVIEVGPLGEPRRWFEGTDELRAGRQIVVPDGAGWFAMSDHDAFPSFFGPSGAVRFVTPGPDEVVEVTAQGEPGQAVGERLFLAPDQGADGLPDVRVTVRPGVDRALAPQLDPPRDMFDIPIAPPGLTASSFGEAFATGRLLAGEAPVAAIGAPAVNQQTGAVWVYAGALAVSGPLANGGRNARQGHRLAVLPRPGADRDALVVGGGRMTEARIWTLIRAVDGRPVIATSTVVRVPGAASGFGRALAVSEAGLDGTRRLFIGEPVGAGRVHVFSVR